MINKMIENIIKSTTNSKELNDIVKKYKNTLIAKEFGKEAIILTILEEEDSFTVYSVHINFETSEYKFDQFFGSLWYNEPMHVKSFKSENGYFLIETDTKRDLIITQILKESSPYIIKLEDGRTGTGSWTKKEIGL